MPLETRVEVGPLGLKPCRQVLRAKTCMERMTGDGAEVQGGLKWRGGWSRFQEEPAGQAVGHPQRFGQ